MVQRRHHVAHDGGPAARLETVAQMRFRRFQRARFEQQSAEHGHGRGDVHRVDIERRIAAHLGHRITVRRDADLAARQALTHRQPPTLGQAREGGEQAAAVQRIQLRIGQVGHHLDPAVDFTRQVHLGVKGVGHPAALPGDDQERRVQPLLGQRLPHAQE